MNKNWEQHKWIFEIDGSLRDIYIPYTNLDDWNILIDYLNANIKLNYLPSSKSQIDKQYVINLLLDTKEELECRTASLLIEGLSLNCHFFCKDVIEFDLDPKEVKGQQEFETIIGFLENICSLLKKQVYLTWENSIELPIILINPGQAVKILTSDELKKSNKKKIAWLGRLKGKYVSALMNLYRHIGKGKLKRLIEPALFKMMKTNEPYAEDLNRRLEKMKRKSPARMQ